MATLDDKTAMFFGENAKTVREYLTKTPAGGGAMAERATRAASTNDRKARWDIVNVATYWLARWERFGAVC